MRKTRRKQKGAAAASIFFLAGLAMWIHADQMPFTGKVIPLDKESLSIEKKFERAFNEFKKEGKTDAYLTGYIYLSRHNIRFGEEGLSGPYNVYTGEGKIKVRRPGRESFSSTSDTNAENTPAGIIFLHDGQSGQILDISQIDLEKTYKIEDCPLFWFGRAGNEESFRFFADRFASEEPRIQIKLIFFIASHVHSQAPAFLKDVALGPYHTEARENAIFWLGSNVYEKSLDYLREIYKKEESSKLREKVIFSFYLLGNETAVKELIQAARSDTSVQVRKQAIFWIGQKASEESVKTLKGVVDDSKEETSVKESAVFAISQLPKDKSVPLLIQIARSNRNPTVRKNAIFWLGQKDSAEALRFFEEILLKKK